MKTPKRWNSRLLSAILAIILVFTIVPLLPEKARADWKDDLWSVYSQMTGEDAQEEVQDSKESEQKSDQSNKQKSDKKNNKNKNKNKNSNNNKKDNKSNDSSNSKSDKKQEETEVKYDDNNEPASLDDVKVEKNGEYTSKWEVAAYIHQYGKLPSNFIKKNQAKKLGWDNKLGNLAKVAPGKSIGGDHFGNYEGQLPEAKGRDYFECDIDYESGYRSEKRIIYSDDGMIYYTEDHYETFDQLYPED